LACNRSCKVHASFESRPQAKDECRLEARYDGGRRWPKQRPCRVRQGAKGSRSDARRAEDGPEKSARSHTGRGGNRRSGSDKNDQSVRTSLASVRERHQTTDVTMAEDGRSGTTAASPKGTLTILGQLAVIREERRGKKPYQKQLGAGTGERACRRVQRHVH
jgi:hypothetical protein